MRLYWPGINAFVGYPGEGKTLAMTEGAIQAQQAGCLIASNYGFHTQDYEFATVPDLVKIVVKQLNTPFEIRQRLLILVDEAGLIFNARDWKDFETEMRFLFMEGRHIDASVAYSVPDLADVDASIRRVTSRIVLCRGYFPKKYVHEGSTVVRERNRIYSRYVYSAREFGKAKARPQSKDRCFLKKDVAAAYDTFGIVLAARQMIVQAHEPS